MNSLMQFLLVTQAQVEDILEPVFTIISAVVPVLLLLVGSVGSIFCIVLGVKFAKSEDPQEHEKAKKGLINAIIGFVLIFVLLIALQVAMDVFIPFWTDWS